MTAFESFDVCALHPARELVGDSGRASELLATLEAADLATIQHVKLSNKSYTLEAAECVAAKCAGMTSVVSVDVSDIIAGRPEAEALQVLSTISSAFAARRSELTSLDVSDNALGQKGIDALLPLLGAEKLRSLRICNNGMSAAAAKQLVTLVNPEGLETLHYHNNMSGDEGAMALAELVARAHKLVDFRFSGTRAGRPGSLAVAVSLADKSRLQKLDLVDNVLGQEGGQAIGAFLEEAKPPLLHLDLRDCALGDDGFEAVAAALESAAPQLRHLDVSGNELTTLAALPETCVAHLETLAVEENELANTGALELANVVGRTKLNDSLTTIVASTNEIGAKAAVALCRVLKAACPNLAKVELDGNCIGADALDQLSAILGDGILGDMDDNDEEAAEDDEGDLDDLIQKTDALAVA